jgi:ABC-type antimicrobial peptide transport system permease subunit
MKPKSTAGGVDKRKYAAKYIRMRILVSMAYKNLAFKRLRTFLTVLGVVIGIGAIVFLVSLGLGLQKVVTEQIVGSKSVKAIDVSSPKPRVIRLNNDAIKKFAGYQNVDAVAQTFSFAGKVIFQSANTDSVINGSDQNYLDLSSFKLEEGKNIALSSDDEVLVNMSLLKTIGISDKTKIMGQKVKVVIPKEKRKEAGASESTEDYTKELKVVGVLESGSGAEVFTTDTLLLNAGFQDYNQAKVVVKTKEDVPAVRKQIESQGFITASPVDTLDQINQVFTILNILLAGFGGIGMVIAVLGMFNTLTISLLERTKEIGLLISLGARRKDVRRLFIIEALALSFMGALFGLVIAWLLGKSINLLLFNLAQSRGVQETFSVFFIPLWLIVGIIMFTALTGMIVVAYPARRASRINPIDALRHE